jgi:glutamate--cysteine ligase
LRIRIRCRDRAWSPPNRFYLYGVIARLAMVAASYELEATDPEARTDE